MSQTIPFMTHLEYWVQFITHIEYRAMNHIEYRVQFMTHVESHSTLYDSSWIQSNVYDSSWVQSTVYDSSLYHGPCIISPFEKTGPVKGVGGGWRVGGRGGEKGWKLFADLIFAKLALILQCLPFSNITSSEYKIAQTQRKASSLREEIVYIKIICYCYKKE